MRQTEAWTGDIGKEYTDRNALPLDKLDSLYLNRYGFSRTQLNSTFIGNLDKKIRILEVGSNIGNQLALLQKAGFTNLYGIDIQPYAVEIAKRKTQGINIIQGSAYDIPFKDNFFDLVLTSGLLIHIPPVEIEQALKEIIRCTRKYIWCFEYFAKQYTPIVWRGQQDLVWKTDFLEMFLKYPELRLAKQVSLKYIANHNVDMMFLLEKT